MLANEYTRTVYLNFGCLIAIIKQIWVSLNDNVITDFLSEKLNQNQLFLMKWIMDKDNGIDINL